MNIVRVENIEQMKELIRQIFFREENEFTEYGDPVFSFEDIVSLLDIDTRDMIPADLEIYSCEWFEAQDNLGPEDLANWVLEQGKCPMLEKFTPGILFWHLEDGFDRLSGFEIRVFNFVPDAETSFESHMAWRAEQQAEYDEQVRIYQEVARMRATQSPPRSIANSTV